MFGKMKKMFRGKLELSNLNTDEKDIAIVMGAMKHLRMTKELDDVNAFRVSRDSMMNFLINDCNVNQDTFLETSNMVLNHVNDNRAL